MTTRRNRNLAASRHRRKGVRGEREVAAMWRDAGFDVRGLEGYGDHLIVCGDGLVIHSETKRQERTQLPMWVRQAEAETPQSAIAVVAWRPSHMDWRADLSLVNLIRLVQAATR